jgi:alpha-amylase/alpha-mannosidase (GH57 family)
MPGSKKYVCVHGHFYQPPRENAWLEVVEQQESARPYHDWNERINFECYAPNAAARILDHEGWITKIRNNYNRISFNFGPTLLAWLEANDPETYSLILQADQNSRERHGGHGNALAQVYSHLIMPLANYRDKVTQVYWGVRDFERRFGRYPEGMWLAETAVDLETLEVLAAHGIRFTLLAPHQAAAVRRVGEESWRPVRADTLDTRRPYWCVLPSGRRIALFFYHGPVSQAVAFERLLNDGRAFAERLLGILDGSDEPQLAHIATDGETYGHHHRFGEMALAMALNYIEDGNQATLTNYGQYLEWFPPEWEVQIAENTSWSCSHGVERWRSDCGCNTGAHPNWHQRWRKPLRDALDYLRDQMAPAYEREAGRFFKDPWKARNDYIEVVLQRSEKARTAFFRRNVRRELSALEQVTALRLLEMQRFALLMYTSCGWFFDDISGIETNQILQYALRAMDYTQETTGLSLHGEFEKRLRLAPSNRYSDGATSYLQNVVPARITLERVAAHFAVASLFEETPEHLNLYNYSAQVEAFERVEAGTPRLAMGRLRICSHLTQAELTYTFSALYLGQQHIIGHVSETIPRPQFETIRQNILAAFRRADLGAVIQLQQDHFGAQRFSLSTLFSDEKIRIMRAITAQSLQVAEVNLRNVFNDNYQLIIGLQEVGLPVPDSWRHITAYVLTHDLLRFFESNASNSIQTLRRIGQDLRSWSIKLTDEEAVQHAAALRIYREIRLLQEEHPPIGRLYWLIEVLEVLKDIDLRLDVWRSQNLFYLITKGYRKGEWLFLNEDWKGAFERLAQLLSVRL